jgi:hypothetical protein
MLDIQHKPFWLAAVVFLGFATNPSCAEQAVKFEIMDIDDQTAEKFKQEFFARKKTLEDYLASEKFTELFSDQIRVEVLNLVPPVSEGLLPAWEGQRGVIKYAAQRVREGKATTLHELVHVYAPNQVRFLAEGFSVYVEERLGNIEVYPTHGSAIEPQVKTAALASVQLDLFDRVSTKRGVPLGNNVGLEAAIPDQIKRWTYSYLVSGSFVKFLIDRYGLVKFKALYDMTPLTPGVAEVANPRRYEGVFGKSLTELQTEWLRWLDTTK